MVERDTLAGTMGKIADPERVVAALSTAPAVIYDGECPFCSRYVRWAKLRESVGPVKLIDARSLPPATLATIRSRYDLDQGMIFSHAGRIYWGADAIQAMSMLSGSGAFTRMSAAIFRRRWLATLLYPLLRLGRNMAICLKGRGNIHASD